MKVLMRGRDLSDEYLRFAQQIGADGLDIHHGADIPGCSKQGYPDREGLQRLMDRLSAAGLGVYRVAPMDPARYLRGEDGGEEDVDNLRRTLEAFGEVGIPFMSMPVHLGNPGTAGWDTHVHRGGYTFGGFDVQRMERNLAAKPYVDPVPMDLHWERCVELYSRLVPVAEGCGVKLITHPSDPPLPNTDLSPRRWFGLMDAVPSDYNGLLFCVGTRYESGADVCESIRTWGKRGKILHTHIRNVRGTIPSSGGYEEVAIDDGDMDMLQILRTLQEVGFDGGLQIDHLPDYDFDDEHQKVASAFAVGYLKALLAGLKST